MLLVVVMLGAGAVLYWGPRWAPRVAEPGSRSRLLASRKSPSIPRIDLARLESAREPALAGRRDLFDFGRAPAAPTPAAPAPRAVDASMPEAPAPASPVRPGPASNVQYIGSVQDARGLKVAVLLADDVVLTGRVGDLVGHRFRIVQIGYESVDIEELGSDRVRRLPLRASP